MQRYYSGDENASNTVSYERSKMQKDIILQMLKKKGCRITKQRMMLLDIILEEDCSCCKEIYYKASKIDPKIGTATVYRMINTLEEIGAISRKNMYKVHCTESYEENGDGSPLNNFVFFKIIPDTIIAAIPIK
jgi:Fur family transcriptional regulator, ferric uptake regulator